MSKLKAPAQTRPFGVKDKLGYAMGDLANNLTLAMVNSYLLVFYTKVLGVPGAIIGTIFMLSKIVDAFTDVAVGRFCDTWKGSAHGRFSPVMRFFAVPVALFSCLLYNYFIVDWPYAAKLVYIVITYLLYGSIGYTGVNIPYGSMASVITDNPKERSQLSVFRTLGSGVAGLLLGIVIPMVVYSKDANGNNVANGPGFLTLAAIFGVLAILLYTLCSKWCIERVKIAPKADSKERNSLLTSLKLIAKNRAFVGYLLAALFLGVGFNAHNALVQYLFLDVYEMPGLSGMTSICAMLGVYAMVPFIGKLTTKFGKKEVCSVSLLLTAAIYLIIYVFHISNPYVYLVLLLIGMFGMGCFSLVTWAIITDCIDYQEVVTGERNDGTIYACQSFVTKLGGAISGSIGGWTLTLIGYNGMAIVQSAAVKSSLFTCATVIPFVGFLIAGLSLLFIYPLTREKVNENNAILRAKKEKQG